MIPSFDRYYVLIIKVEVISRKGRFWLSPREYFFPDIYFTISYAPKAAVTHRITFNAMQKQAVIYFPPCNNLITSIENVENVVKPPHTPVIKKSSRRGSKFAVLAECAAIMPIMNDPDMLMHKVVKGNPIRICIGSVARPNK